MNRIKRSEIFKRFQMQNPNPTTELIFNSEFELLVSVILSAQATDRGVNKATAVLYKIANTPQQILDLGLEKLTDYLKSINYYKTKAKNVLKTCEILIEKHHGRVPFTRETLETLPGVGRKTANVLLNTLFGHSAVPVDTHIFRISNRTAIAPGKNPREVEDKLIKFVPEEYLKNAHHWLVLHGRYICLARKPKCNECLINDLCEYKDKTL